jgi:hypothetical protein
MKLCIFKETTIMNNLPNQKSQFVIMSISLYQMIQKYFVVHYVIVMLMIMIFLVVKCSSIKDVVGLNVVFIILQK